MKKIAILTSMLVLAACGGGSKSPESSPVGNHVSGSTIDLTIPSSLRGAVTSAESNLNKEVTGMRSEVIVSSGTSVPLFRSSSVINASGIRFVSYRLDDIKLYAADSDNTGDGYLQIGMDDDTGRIESILTQVGGAGAHIARVGNTAQFNGPIFEYVIDKGFAKVADSDDVFTAPSDSTTEQLATAAHNNHFGEGKWFLDPDENVYKYIRYGDQAKYRVVDTGQDMDALEQIESEQHLSGGHWNRVDEIMDVVTYGKNIGTDDDGNDIALQYSDFGHFNPVYKTKLVDLISKSESGWTAHISKDQTADVNDLLEKEDYQLFAGGYAIKGTSMAEDRPSLTPAKGATFKGMAIGRVYTSIQGSNNDAREAHFSDYHITGDGHDITKHFETKGATMTISADGNTQTLWMPFYSDNSTTDQFYDVTITQTGNNAPSFEFAATDPTDIASQYQIHDAFDKNEDGSYKYVQGASFHPGYYGVNTASEAAGTARIYSEHEFNDGVTREYEFQAAYGMKK